MRSVNLEEFDRLLSSEKVLLVDFFAMWCGPCKMLMPTLEKISEEFDGRATIVKINIDDVPELAERYGILSIPTLVYMKNGKEIDRSVGMVTKSDIEKSLNKIL